MLSKYRLGIIGLFIGAIAGWCYGRFVGCSSGNCPITSRPLNSTLYGAVMGGLGLSIFRKEEQTNKH